MWSEHGLTRSCCIFFDSVGFVYMCVYVQINHKYPERRLLVAESCGALAPYLPVRFIRLPGKTTSHPGCPRFDHRVIFMTFKNIPVGTRMYTTHFDNCSFAKMHSICHDMLASVIFDTYVANT